MLKYGDRRRLPNKRPLEIVRMTMPDKPAGASFIVSVGFFEDTGQPAELFMNTDMRSEADAPLHDGAVAVSLALQYGCPVEVLAAAMKRNMDGSPQGLLGAAVDRMISMRLGPDQSEHVHPSKPNPTNNPDAAKVEV